jgi:hypothetical protein
MPTPCCANTFDQKTIKTMKNKTKIALTRTLTGLVTLIIIVSASGKLAFVPQLVEIFSKIGLLSYLKILGTTELVFLALFLWNKTRKLGLLLLTGYFGGAMAVEMSHGTFFIAPATILALTWITAYLHDEKIFVSENKEVRKPATTIL